MLFIKREMFWDRIIMKMDNLGDNANFGKAIDGKISVIISTYDDQIDFVIQCLNSLLYQEQIYDIVIIDSSKKDDIKKFCQSFSGKNENKVNYIYTPPKGLSDARNKGMKAAKKNIVAFTDSDCVTDENWARQICISFDSSTNGGLENVAVVGGKILPNWISKPNKILSDSAISQGFYSLFDMGEELKEIDQIYGGNFAINKRLIMGSFSTELGRKKDDANLLSGEETMLCRQVKEDNNLKIIYNPYAVVWHQIPEERSNFRWMWKRIYYGGFSRSVVGGVPTPKEVNIPYNIYDSIFLTIFIIPYICGLINGLIYRPKDIGQK
jgi:glycosyltransferase involved in cell wall biosynthesis